MSEAGALMYAWLIPTGLLIGHVGIAAKVLPRLGWLAFSSRWLARAWAVAALVAWLLRTVEVGHLPLFGTYESALSLALATVLVAVVWEVAGRGRLPLAPLGALVAAALLNHGRGFDPTPYALTISERSWMVDIHAILAWLAFGVLAVNSTMALAALLPRGRSQELVSRWLLLSLRLGFALHSAMIATGSIYKFFLFGTAWSFDPIETLAAVVWVAYGTIVHLHLLAGWEGKRLAAWCLALFVLLVISYRAIVYFPAWSTYHIFDMDLRLHIGPAESVPEGGAP